MRGPSRCTPTSAATGAEPNGCSAKSVNPNRTVRTDELRTPAMPARRRIPLTRFGERTRSGRGDPRDGRIRRRKNTSLRSIPPESHSSGADPGVKSPHRVTCDGP